MPGLWILILADFGGRSSRAALVSLFFMLVGRQKERQKFLQVFSEMFSPLGKRLLRQCIKG